MLPDKAAHRFFGFFATTARETSAGDRATGLWVCAGG